MKLLSHWSQLSNCVWENRDGHRVHFMGFVALSGGGYYWINRFPESVDIERSIRICGGNVRRGLMLFAETKGGSDATE